MAARATPACLQDPHQAHRHRRPEQPLLSQVPEVTVILVVFCRMPDFSIGVDLGGTNLRIAAVTTDGQLLEKVTLGTKLSRAPIT